MAVIGLICLMGSYVPSFSKEVAVEELSISLYNKPVTGFRFTLERQRAVCRQPGDCACRSCRTYAALSIRALYYL